MFRKIKVYYIFSKNLVYVLSSLKLFFAFHHPVIFSFFNPWQIKAGQVFRLNELGSLVKAIVERIVLEEVLKRKLDN